MAKSGRNRLIIIPKHRLCPKFLPKFFCVPNPKIHENITKILPPPPQKGHFFGGGGKFIKCRFRQLWRSMKGFVLFFCFCFFYGLLLYQLYLTDVHFFFTHLHQVEMWTSFSKFIFGVLDNLTSSLAPLLNFSLKAKNFFHHQIKMTSQTLFSKLTNRTEIWLPFLTWKPSQVKVLLAVMFVYHVFQKFRIDQPDSYITFLFLIQIKNCWTSLPNQIIFHTQPNFETCGNPIGKKFLSSPKTVFFPT